MAKSKVWLPWLYGSVIAQSHAYGTGQYLKTNSNCGRLTFSFQIPRNWIKEVWLAGSNRGFVSGDGDSGSATANDGDLGSRSSEPLWTSVSLNCKGRGCLPALKYALISWNHVSKYSELCLQIFCIEELLLPQECPHCQSHNRQEITGPSGTTLSETFL